MPAACCEALAQILSHLVGFRLITWSHRFNKTNTKLLDMVMPAGIMVSSAPRRSTRPLMSSLPLKKFGLMFLGDYSWGQLRQGQPGDQHLLIPAARRSLRSASHQVPLQDPNLGSRSNWCDFWLDQKPVRSSRHHRGKTTSQAKNCFVARWRKSNLRANRL